MMGANMIKKNAPTANSNESTKTKGHSSKKNSILAVLRTRSLNRFEAERHGDHCLHSTISELRKDGHAFHDEWETVPTRFRRDVRVKRYYLTHEASKRPAHTMGA